MEDFHEPPGSRSGYVSKLLLKTVVSFPETLLLTSQPLYLLISIKQFFFKLFYFPNFVATLLFDLFDPLVFDLLLPPMLKKPLFESSHRQDLRPLPPFDSKEGLSQFVRLTLRIPLPEVFFFLGIDPADVIFGSDQKSVFQQVVHAGDFP